jgi:hypothetical protein
MLIPFSAAVLAKILIREVRFEVGNGLADDMKICKHHPRNRADRAQLDNAVSQCTVFIHATLLVVFGIVREGSKDLRGHDQPNIIIFSMK